MRICIGLPFLNAAQTLDDAIRSVFAQTCQDWRLLLVDDGSTDQSLDIAMAVADPRVSVISDGRNMGLQKRLNQIAGLAREEYLARMDADDIMHPERLARQIAFLDSHPQVDMVGTAVYTIDTYNRVTSVRHEEPIDTSPASILRRGFICHPTAMARSDWFRRNRYDESFAAAEDHELFSRAAHSSSMARLPEPLLYYRETHKDPRAYLARYKQHSLHMRRCYLKHGPHAVGWANTLALLMQSHLKVAIYKLATVAGVQDAVIRRRSGRVLTAAELLRALDGLYIARHAKVPGLTPQKEVPLT